jgi:hypothetical protein
MAAMLLPRLLLHTTIDRSERILITANGDRGSGLCPAIYLKFIFFLISLFRQKSDKGQVTIGWVRTAIPLQHFQ